MLYLKASVKKYLPIVGRLFIVTPFLEETAHMVVPWLNHWEKGQILSLLSRSIVFGLLVVYGVTMVSASYAVVFRKKTGIAVALLSMTMLLQAITYDLVFDLAFFLRNLSITGSLLLCLSESLLRRRKKSIWAALPRLPEGERQIHLQVAGRVLLVLLFIGYVVNGEWSFSWLIVSTAGLVACSLMTIVFRSQWSLTFLISVLSIVNGIANSWCSVQAPPSHQDTKKYDIAHALSVVGSVLVLISIGSGSLISGKKYK
ncbi:SURF4 family-domain-containing protein [Spinellus fusiger]|nr:SURF4 family-domain-containing protein [Spinellus fusiger]